MLHACAPDLWQRHGIGPDSAAALLVTGGDNPDRLRSEASFAALCGVNSSADESADSRAALKSAELVVSPNERIAA